MVVIVFFVVYYFMLEIICSFQVCYFQVCIWLIDSSVGNVIEVVSSGQVDFGFCFVKNLLVSIEFIFFVDDCYVVVCWYDYLLVCKMYLSWQVYFEQDYIGLDWVFGNWMLFDWELVYLMLVWLSICEICYVIMMLGMVEVGIGIVVVFVMLMFVGEYFVFCVVLFIDLVVMCMVGLICFSGCIQFYVVVELEKLIIEQYFFG